MRAEGFEYAPKEVGDDASLRPGYYKTRTKKRGPYIPVEIVELCHRDESGHLCDDVKYNIWAWPGLHEIKPFRWSEKEVDPMYLRPIEKDEFEWMMLLKTL